MSIAITDDHRSLADSVAQTLRRRDARAAAHALLDAPTEERPAFSSDLVSLGLTGLHVPEEYGGAGGGIEDLVVAVEDLGKAVAPGPCRSSLGGTTSLRSLTARCTFSSFSATRVLFVPFRDRPRHLLAQNQSGPSVAGTRRRA